MDEGWRAPPCPVWLANALSACLLCEEPYCKEKEGKKKPQQTTKTTGQIPAIRNNKTKVSGDVPVHGNAVRSFILAFYGYLLLWLVSRRNERYRTGCGQEESMGTSH